MIDVDHALGGVWAGDTARRWGAGAVELPVRSVGRIARSAFKDANLLPGLDSAFRYAEPTVMRSRPSPSRTDGGRSPRATPPTPRRSSSTCPRTGA